MNFQFNKNSNLIIILIMTSLVLFLFAIEQFDVFKEKNNIQYVIGGQNSLIITEIMSSNDGTYVDENGNLYDWIELYNGTEKDINLKNYGLSDDSKKVKCLLPEKTIKSKEYLVV